MTAFEANVSKLARAGYSQRTTAQLLGVSRRRLTKLGPFTGRVMLPWELVEMLERKEPYVPDNMVPGYKALGNLVTGCPGTSYEVACSMVPQVASDRVAEWRDWFIHRIKLKVLVFKFLEGLT